MLLSSDLTGTFFALMTIVVVEVSCQRIPDNPCSNVFRYAQQNGIYYGEVEIPNDGSTMLNFAVNVSLVGLYQNPDSLKLRLELLTPQDNIRSQPRLNYRVYFPLQNVLPKVTQITYNGRLYCSGPPEPVGNQGVTNVWGNLVISTLTLSGGTAINHYPNELIIIEEEEEIPQQNGNQPRPEIDLDRNPFLQQPPTSPPPPPPTRPRPTQPRPTPTRPTQSGQTQSWTTQRRTTQPWTTQRWTTKPRPTTQRWTTRPPQTNRPVLHTTTPTESRPVQTSKPLRPSSLDTSPLYVSERLPDDDSCGVANDIQSLVIDGETTVRNEYPWLVAIFNRQGVSYQFHCSSNLVNAMFVVTAAHCVQFFKAPIIPKEDILLVLGEWDLTHWATSGATIRGADQVIVHPEYRQFTGHCDIALIKFKERVHFKRSIRPICLWSGESSSISQGTVAGWGVDENGRKTTPIPKKVTMKMASQETCLRSNSGFSNLTSELTFCAGNRDGSGPCTGDSGAGFMVNQSGKWFLRGLVSTAIKSDNDFSCDLYEYIVFSDVKKLSSWIKTMMK